LGFSLKGSGGYGGGKCRIMFKFKKKKKLIDGLNVKIKKI
jgi:hypothetical protein